MIVTTTQYLVKRQSLLPEESAGYARSHLLFPTRSVQKWIYYNHRELIFPLSRFLTIHPNEFGVNFSPADILGIMLSITTLNHLHLHLHLHLWQPRESRREREREREIMRQLIISNPHFKALMILALPWWAFSHEIGYLDMNIRVVGIGTYRERNGMTERYRGLCGA
ncbi:hypothetical protein I7I48_09842 [Histoplasma ohiense]|nr:hypothetical protein I7I48_09842 [Histoplasma ohiense (nom. inval.)]